jgi:hypothetical protein
MKSIAVIALLILAGCAPVVSDSLSPGDNVVLQAYQEAGGLVVLTLQNASGSDIRYNLCASGLEVRTLGARTDGHDLHDGTSNARARGIGDVQETAPEHASGR